MPDRRAFLAGAAAAALSPQLALAKRPGGFVPSDFAPLRRVLVCEPSPSDFSPSLTERSLLNLLEGDPDALVGQHRAVQRLLAASGAEVLALRDVLQSAIEAARSRGQWGTWLRATHPRLAGNPDAVTADTLMGRDPAVQLEADGSGDYRHVVDVSVGKMFTRDQGVMTPRGLILSNLHPPHRRGESYLTRFAFDFAPQLARYPIVFDAAVEGLYAEGGDFQVVDERTLFVGVGNRTAPRIGQALARRLEMDVITVQSRRGGALKWRPPTEMRARLLHLDTYFTHAGPKRALALPWLLEQEFAGRDMLSRYLRGLMKHEGPASDDELDGAVADLKEFGRVRRYLAGSGREDASLGEIKLVDYVRANGYEVTFVGGQPSATPDFDHLFQAVLAEHAHQAANVLATGPDRVIAFDGGRRTTEALRAAGVRVDAVAGRELWAFNGGPHCLTPPLERA